MKRVVTGITRVLKSSKFKKFAVALLIFGIGVLCGSVITGAVSKDSKPSASRSSSNISNEDRAKRTSERLEEAYKRAKDRTQKDLEAKRIDQKKQMKLTKSSMKYTTTAKKKQTNHLRISVKNYKISAKSGVIG